MDAAFVSIKVAAAVTSLSPKSVRQLITDGQLEAARYGTRLLIPAASLQQWIEDKTEEARLARSERNAQDALRGRYALTAMPESPAIANLRTQGKSPTRLRRAGD